MVPMTPSAFAGRDTDGPTASAEDALADAVRRAGRQPHGRIALVLHLSRMAPPAPRPHHRRIARAMLRETADLHEGHVFTPRNGDLVLLCRAPASGTPASGVTPRPGAAATPDPATLPETLGRLLRVDAPDPSRIVSVWRLDQDFAALAAYVGERRAETIVAPPAEAGLATPMAAVAAMATLVSVVGVNELMRRRTAVSVHGPRHGAGTAAEQVLRPIFRELAFAIPTLESRCRAVGQARADPFLFRHLARQLDRRMLEVLGRELGTGGPLDLAAGQDRARGAARGLVNAPPPPHLNLTVQTILSDGFGALAASCQERGAAIGVEVALIDACADIAGYMAAARVVRGAGMTLVLDEVSDLALILARPTTLPADLLKLAWSPRLLDLGGGDAAALRDALTAFGPHRVVLCHAATEAALRSGLAWGIRKFQGQHIETILAAGRTRICPLSADCSRRQCADRGTATGRAGRSGCGNPTLLDAGPDPGGEASLDIAADQRALRRAAQFPRDGAPRGGAPPGGASARHPFTPMRA